ncbi:MAG: TraX family protein [Planctomycetota bacterium]
MSQIAANAVRSDSPTDHGAIGEDCYYLAASERVDKEPGMKKQPRRRPNPHRPPQQKATPNRKESEEQAKGPRNHTLDSLRGLAIALMIVDHVVGIVIGLSIQDSIIRFCTRLAMPLFCVLMGYFLREDRRFEWHRPAQILAAAFAVNMLFFPYYGTIEILGTLLLAYLAFVAAGRHFPWFVLVIAFYRFDPLRSFFDYPPTMVIAFVAQGAMLRRHGLVPALVSGMWLSSGAVWIHALEPNFVNHRLCLFILPATLLVYLGQRFPTVKSPGFDWLGRHPLAVYVVQYYLVFLAARIVQLV